METDKITKKEIAKQVMERLNILPDFIQNFEKEDINSWQTTKNVLRKE